MRLAGAIAAVIAGPSLIPPRLPRASAAAQSLPRRFGARQRPARSGWLLGLLVALTLPTGLTGCRAQDAPAKPVPSGIASRAPSLMRAYGCTGCHAIPGVPGADGRVGPPLVAMADRAYVAGVLPNTHDALVQWIRFPTRVNPKTVMPDMGVTHQDALDMAAYLATLHAQPRSVRMLQGFVERAIGRPVPDTFARPATSEEEP
jgi:cytochrome c2